MRRLYKIARLRPLLGLVLLPLLAGCGGGGSNGGGSGSPAPAAPVTAPAAPLSVSATLSDGLTATLAEDKAAVPVGGSVTYTLTLKNGTTQPITFVPTYDLEIPSVPQVSGTLAITSPSGGTAYPTPIGTTTAPGGVIGPATTLAPGQSASGALGPIDVFTAPGTYAAIARFAFDSPVLSSPTVGPLTVTVQ